MRKFQGLQVGISTGRSTPAVSLSAAWSSHHVPSHSEHNTNTLIKFYNDSERLIQLMPSYLTQNRSLWTCLPCPVTQDGTEETTPIITIQTRIKMTIRSGRHVQHQGWKWNRCILTNQSPGAHMASQSQRCSSDVCYLYKIIILYQCFFSQVFYFSFSFRLVD